MLGNFISTFLLGVGLSMDAFAVSVCKGLAVGRVKAKHLLSAGLWFGAFQALMPLIGFFLGASFHSYIEAFDHWIAFGLLTYLGLKMIYESFSRKKSMGNAKKKEMLTMTTTVIMAVATSIDAMTVGISMACVTGISLMMICRDALIVALCSLGFSVAGLCIGIYGSKKTDWHIEAIGGVILLAIGIKILIEHTT